MLTTERRQTSKAARERYEAAFTSRAGPIVVGGCGRSGTTLRRNILDTHSLVCCGPESTLFLGPLLAFDNEQISRLVVDFDMSREQIERLIAGSSSHAQFLEDFLSSNAAQQGKQIWAAKTPRNVNTLEYVFRHFPRAKFVHVIRDARDTVCSFASKMRSLAQ